MTRLLYCAGTATGSVTLPSLINHESMKRLLEKISGNGVWVHCRHAVSPVDVLPYVSSDCKFSGNCI